MGKIFCVEFQRVPHKISFIGENLRDLTFKSSYAFLKCPPVVNELTPGATFTNID